MVLTIHRGTREIGGSCVELATDTTRLLMDVGQPLTAASDGLVARVCSGQPSVSAVLLSHSHGDHTGLLKEVPSGVPFFLSKGTSKMMMLGGCYAGQVEIERGRQTIVDCGKPFHIGDFTVTAHAVDHSAYGSVAFMVEAGGRRLLYSGDLRMHGRKPGMMRSLVRAACARPLDALVMEGTHFSSGREAGVSEETLEDEIHSDIKESPGLVWAAFSPMHVDRLVTFYKATRRAGRTLVLDHYGASVLRFIARECKVPLPTPRNGIRVFFPSRRKVIARLEAPLQGAAIHRDEILSAPQRFVMLFRPSMLDGDFAGQPPDQVCCIYSYWSGYLKKPEWSAVRDRITAAGGRFIQRHSSGHIYAPDIIKLVREINPRRVIPIHTDQPEEFRRHFPNALLLGDGERHDVGK